MRTAIKEPQELTIDPEIQDELNEHTDEELLLLRDSLERDGCRDPIIVWANHNNTIIDGHTRYRLCLELGIPYTIKALKFASKADVLCWVYENQHGRRNSTAQQRSLQRARQFERYLQLGKAGDERASDIASQVAEKAGVSVRQLWSDIKAEEGVQKIEKVAPDLAKAIKSGKAKIGFQSIKEIAGLVDAQPAKAMAAAERAMSSRRKRQLKKSAIVCPEGNAPETVVKDDLGTPVPLWLEEAFRSRKLYSSVKQLMGVVEDELKGIFSAGGGGWCHRQSAEAAVKNVINEVCSCRPHCICPKCKGAVDGSLATRCTFCKGLGYMSRSAFERLGAKDRR